MLPRVNHGDADLVGHAQGALCFTGFQQHDADLGDHLEILGIVFKDLHRQSHGLVPILSAEVLVHQQISRFAAGLEP